MEDSDLLLARRLQLEEETTGGADQEEHSFRFTQALQQQQAHLARLLGKTLNDDVSEEDLAIALQRMDSIVIGDSSPSLPTLASLPPAPAKVVVATSERPHASNNLVEQPKRADKESAEHKLCSKDKPEPESEQEVLRRRQAEEKQRLLAAATVATAVTAVTDERDATQKKAQQESKEEEMVVDHAADRRRFKDEQRTAALRRRERESGWEAPPMWPASVRFIMKNEEAWEEDLSGREPCTPASGSASRPSSKTTIGEGVPGDYTFMLPQIEARNDRKNNSDLIELRQLGPGHPAYDRDVVKYHRNDGRSYGAFAKAFIPKRTVIAQYCGLLVESSGAYRLPINNTTDIDAEFAGSEARFINDHRGTGKACNVQFIPHPHQPEFYVVSLDDIQAGDELLLDYGEEYWKDIDQAERHMQSEDEEFIGNNSPMVNRNVTPKRLRSSRSSLNESRLLAKKHIFCAACHITVKVNSSGWVDLGTENATELLEVWWSHHSNQCTTLLPEAGDDDDDTDPASETSLGRARKKARQRAESMMRRHLMVMMEEGKIVPLHQLIAESSASSSDAQPERKRKRKRTERRIRSVSPEWKVIRATGEDAEEDTDQDKDQMLEQQDADLECDVFGGLRPTPPPKPADLDKSSPSSPFVSSTETKTEANGDGQDSDSDAGWRPAKEEERRHSAVFVGSTHTITPTLRKKRVTKWHIEESDGKAVCIIDDDDDVTVRGSSSTSTSISTPTSRASSSPSSFTTPPTDKIKPKDEAVPVSLHVGGDGDSADDIEHGGSDGVEITHIQRAKRKREIDLVASSGHHNDAASEDEEEKDDKESLVRRKPKRPYTNDLPVLPPSTSFPFTAAPTPSAPSLMAAALTSSSTLSSPAGPSVPSSAFPVSKSLSSLFTPSPCLPSVSAHSAKTPTPAPPPSSSPPAAAVTCSPILIDSSSPSDHTLPLPSSVEPLAAVEATLPAIATTTTTATTTATTGPQTPLPSSSPLLYSSPPSSSLPTTPVTAVEPPPQPRSLQPAAAPSHHEGSPLSGPAPNAAAQPNRSASVQRLVGALSALVGDLSEAEIVAVLPAVAALNTALVSRLVALREIVSPDQQRTGS